jgi:hypothetical protein
MIVTDAVTTRVTNEVAAFMKELSAQDHKQVGQVLASTNDWLSIERSMCHATIAAIEKDLKGEELDAAMFDGYPFVYMTASLAYSLLKKGRDIVKSTVVNARSVAETIQHLSRYKVVVAVSDEVRASVIDVVTKEVQDIFEFWSWADIAKQPGTQDKLSGILAMTAIWCLERGLYRRQHLQDIHAILDVNLDVNLTQEQLTGFRKRLTHSLKTIVGTLHRALFWDNEDSEAVFIQGETI